VPVPDLPKRERASASAGARAQVQETRHLSARRTEVGSMTSSDDLSMVDQMRIATRLTYAFFRTSRLSKEDIEDCLADVLEQLVRRPLGEVDERGPAVSWCNECAGLCSTRCARGDESTRGAVRRRQHSSTSAFH
jgi:hypothetical protein